MAKVSREAQAMLLPVPAVMVSCGEEGKPANIITIAYTGVVGYDPPMVHVGVRTERYSHGIIMRSGEFVINIPTEDQVRITDFCGNVSGSTVDKFKHSGLTPVGGDKVKAPLIKECPVNLECRVRAAITFGTHTHFIGEVVALHMDEEVLDSGGELLIEEMRPLGFCMGSSEYYGMGKKLGDHGFTGGKIKR
jgi:flavin reductase (DIM6/NTAB) family NADH-FMN oxidoreductase RutF